MPTHWQIAHPGTLRPITVASFDEALQRYFEGFNVPRLVVDGVVEPMAVQEHRRLSRSK